MVRESTALALAAAAGVAVIGVGVAVALAFGQPSGGSLSASPSTAVVGQQVTFTVAGGSFSSFNWDFGDGTIPATTSSGFISHAYSTVGVFTATVTATDATGAQTMLTTPVTINPAGATDIPTSLVLSDTPATATVGQTVTASGTLSRNDTGAGIMGQSIAVQTSQNLSSWNTVPTGPIITDANGNYSVGIVFSVAGIYYVRARFSGSLV